jgi:hypothetical protein
MEAIMQRAKGKSLFERCIRLHMESVSPTHYSLAEGLKWILLVLLLLLAALYFTTCIGGR